jgi:type VI secretion system secreted protein Hcp
MLCALVAFGAADTASAAVNAYLKLDGVEGEATDKDHQDWINLESWSGAIPQPGTASGAARRRGDVVLEDIRLVKTADKASAKLAEAVCKGKVIPKVEIYVTASYSDAGRQTYYTYELMNVRVTSYSVSAGAGGAGGDVPTEEVTLNFEEIKARYDKNGTANKGGNAETTWKVEKGAK